jgi:uncharacterized protein YchJ
VVGRGLGAGKRNWSARAGRREIIETLSIKTFFVRIVVLKAMRVGRNDLCPCGSGKKFKKCHLAEPLIVPILESQNPSRSPLPPHIWARIEERTRLEHLQEQERIGKYGNVRPTVHLPDHQGYRLVVVRNRVYWSKNWKFFTDFLFEYGLLLFGKEWFDQQNAAQPADQHPLFRWRKMAFAFMQRQPQQPDGSFIALPNGAMAACNNFYYDLYIVDDNSLLDDDLMGRLRHRDQFQGAMYELFVEATCLRAGFTIVRENEKDPSRRHVEFMAVHKSTGQHVLVEAKSRHRPGVIGQPGAKQTSPDFRFRKLINAAVEKEPKNPLALFVDTNLPPVRAQRFYTPESMNPITPSKAIAALLERIRRDYHGVDPYNLLVMSNHPQHYGEDDTVAPGNHFSGYISRQNRVPVYHELALFDLINAANLYGNVPNHFPPLRDSQVA